MKFLPTQKIFLATALAGLLSTTLPTNAAVIQILPGLTYNNPAMLFMTEHGQFIVEGNVVNPNFTYTGTTAASPNAVGSSSSHQTNILPDALLAIRINPRFVAGLVISSPVY